MLSKFTKFGNFNFILIFWLCSMKFLWWFHLVPFSCLTCQLQIQRNQSTRKMLTTPMYVSLVSHFQQFNPIFWRNQGNFTPQKPSILITSSTFFSCHTVRTFLKSSILFLNIPWKILNFVSIERNFCYKHA